MADVNADSMQQALGDTEGMMAPVHCGTYFGTG
jgi:hypothetical protein